MTSIPLSSLSQQFVSKRDLKRSKSAQKALRKAKRKLRKALHAASIMEMTIAVGMAQTAINKAKFAASAKLK